MSFQDDEPLPAELSDWPTAVLHEHDADDLELALTGAFPCGPRYLLAAERRAVRSARRLPDGEYWELPLALRLPADGPSVSAGGRLVLADAESVPLAVLTVEEVTTGDSGTRVLGGPLSPLRPRSHATFGALRMPPAQVRAERHGPVVAVPTDRPLHAHDLSSVRRLAESTGSDVLILALVGSGRPAHDGLVRSLTSLSNVTLGDGRPARVRLVPLPAHDELRSRARLRLVTQVAARYGADRVWLPHSENHDPSTRDLGPGLPVPVHRGPAGPLSDAELRRRLDAEGPLPPGFTTPVVERELRRAHPPRRERGMALLFTGLSGSGKSTVARAVVAALVERTDRSVTLLDGDVVRTMLSSGLTFSREHRELNVRRIGYVASEIVHHGGTAVCAPIAPYARSRAEVRAMVERHGEFVLVHVSTPLEVCEARDRKGLYAKARAGLIPEFTGVSDPYEVPDDADVVIDTSVLSLDGCVGRLMDHLTQRGLIRPLSDGALRHADGSVAV